MFYLNYQKAVSDIKSRIGRLVSVSKPQTDFLYANITDFRNSDERLIMLKAQEYYRNKNDVLERKRYYIDRHGNQQEAKNLSNSKLAHPSLRKLVRQKVNYLLSKEFSIQTENEAFSKALSEYTDKQFYRMIQGLSTYAIVNGVEWAQAYYNQDGDLKFKRIPAEEIVPFWRDSEHTILDAILRFYSVVKYLPDGSKKQVNKVEYHTVQGVWYFIEDAKGLKPDPEKGDGLQGHFVIRKPLVNENGEEMMDDQGTAMMSDEPVAWDRIPFIPFKYNADELSLLELVKPLIDDYDVNTSDLSNILQDIPNSIKVVRNYDGTDKGEFVQNLALYRTAFVSGDGDLHAVDTKLDVAAIDSHLNRLRKDIYEAGSGVDTQETDLGNASGVALKFRFADLDNDTDELAMELSFSIEQMLWFIQVDMFNKGLGEFFEEEFDIIFNTDGIINESEIILDAKNSVGIISEETIMANHPWVTDVAVEKEKLTKERDEAMVKAQEMMQQDENFGSNEPSGAGNDEGAE